MYLENSPVEIFLSYSRLSMDVIFQQLLHILARLDVLAYADIAILVILFYGLLSVLKGTRAATLVRGLFILFLVAFMIVLFFPLPVLKWLVTNSLQFIIFAIIVIFTPELRRTLEQIGHTSDFINRPLSNRSRDSIRLMIDEVVATSFYLSDQGWGGLMVIERETGLQDLANKGVPINGHISSQLLCNIVPNTPLHDGAVIIRQDQIVAAKVILPLSDNSSKQEHFGTRHKAALGISEQSDAIVVVVSEETGAVSVAHGGKLIIKLERERLRQTLRSLLEPASGRGTRKNNDKVAANKDKSEKIDRAEKTEKPDKIGKPEKVEELRDREKVKSSKAP